RRRPRRILGRPGLRMVRGHMNGQVRFRSGRPSPLSPLLGRSAGPLLGLLFAWGRQATLGRPEEATAGPERDLCYQGEVASDEKPMRISASVTGHSTKLLARGVAFRPLGASQSDEAILAQIGRVAVYAAYVDRLLDQMIWLFLGAEPAQGALQTPWSRYRT